MKLLAHTPLSVAVVAGRTAWQSFHKGGNYKNPTDNITEEDYNFLNRLFNKYKHLSVAEHLKYTFFMTKEEYDEIEVLDDGYLRKGFRLVADGIIVDKEYYVTVDMRWMLEHKEDSDIIKKMIHQAPINHFNLFCGKIYANVMELDYEPLVKFSDENVDFLYMHYNPRVPYKDLNIWEHLVYVTLRFKNISRAMLQELVRHDDYLAATIKSTRYTLKELKNEREFIWTKPIDHGRVTYHYDFERARKYVKLTGDDLVDKVIVTELEDLRKLILSGKSNDVAKFALPEAYLTEGILTIPIRNLKNMIALRDSRDALWEFQVVAKQLRKMYEELKSVALQNITL